MKPNYPEADSADKGVRLANAIESFSTRTSVVRLGIRVLEEIIDMRDKGVFHAVLTPNDIIVYKNGDIRIQAAPQRVPEKSPEFTHLVQLYTAPEAYGYASPDVAVMFSLGTIMYKLLNSGLEPFRQSMSFESAASAYKLRMSGARLSAPQNADALLSAIILKACEYDISRRYSYPEDMLEELRLLADGTYQRKPRQEVKQEEPVPKKSKLPVIAIAVASALVCVGIVVLVLNFVANDTYVRAERYMRDGKISQARELFDDIRWYKDSDNMLLNCDYREARELVDEGKLDKAIELFEELVDRDYDGARKALNDALLKKADVLSEHGKKDEAMEIIASVVSEDEADDMLDDNLYDAATELYENGKFADARDIFQSLGDKEMTDECNYRLAIGSMENKNYTEAMVIFAGLDGYGESDSNFGLCEEWLIAENEKNDVFTSMTANLGRYSDERGFYVEYREEGDKIISSYNLPFERGKYCKLEDGVHYHSKSGTSWEKQWIYEEVSSSRINVYNYIDNKLYTLEAE